MKSLTSIVGTILLVGGMGLTVHFMVLSDSAGEVPNQAIKSDTTADYILRSTQRSGMAYETTADTAGIVTNPTLRVDAGETVTIRFRNTGGGVHDLAIPALGVSSKKLYGQNTTGITFVPDKAGTHAYFCTIPGHRQAGMEGSLVVEKADSEPDDGAS